MGDSLRFRVFASFVQHSFPEARRVADLAGGHGELAYWLYTLGKTPVIIDWREVALPRWVHRTLRKRAIRTGKLPTLERICAHVEDVDLAGFDLIVGLHPDEATEPALRAALDHGLDFAIVPCCVFPLDGARRSREGWIDYLASLSPGILRTSLPIQGANVVLWRKGERAPVLRASLDKRSAGGIA